MRAGRGSLRQLFLLLTLAATPLAAGANDSAITGVGGRWRPLTGEHRSIRMVREDVRIVVHPDYRYDVAACFVFRNEGPAAVTATMGFPESGGGDIPSEEYRRRTGFDFFATSVDGRRVPVRRRSTAPSDDSDYTAYWVKRVWFAPGQTRRVRVRYRSACGGTSHLQQFVQYDFTGGNWRGAVGESTLILTLRVPGTHVVAGEPATGQRGNRFFYRWRNWQAQGYFSTYLQSTWPGWLYVSKNREPDTEDTRTITVGKRPPRFHGKISLERWTPAVLRGGVAFIELNALRGQIADQLGEREDRRRTGLSWDHRSKTAALQVGARTLRFRPESRRMQVRFAGRERADVRLPAPPFAVDNVRRGTGYRLYVPLRPVLDALGGSVEIAPREHRVWFEVGAK